MTAEVSTIPRFSLVFPAYNEEAYLPRLLDAFAKTYWCDDPR